MRNEKTSCRGQFDFLDELSKDVEGDKTQPDKPRSAIRRCPHIKIHIFNTPVEALIDTGSQITCISEALYVRIRNKVAIRELPVSNIQIMSAVTRKCTQVRKQVFLEMTIDNIRIN